MTHPLTLAAYAWWRAKRPETWDIKDHLTMPAIGCKGTHEIELANAVADDFRRTFKVDEYDQG